MSPKKERKKLLKKIKVGTPKGKAVRHFINLEDVGAKALRKILDNAHRMKKERYRHVQVLDGHGLLMVFDKNSFRTLVSFDQGQKQLGGATTIITKDMIHPTETVHDMAKVAEGMVDAVMIRWSSHDFVEEWAKHSRIPVINALTDVSHPCQIMADLMTIEEHGKKLKGLKITWVGDDNNVCRTFAQAAGLFGFELTVSAPKHLKLEGAEYHTDSVHIVRDSKKAVAGADVVVTDTIISMGQKDKEAERDAVLAKFSKHRVTEELMAAAKPDALFMHCLPAHRNEEVTDAVMDGPRSVVFPEAHNRLHVQKAILAYCLENSGVRVKPVPA